jgi:2-dehydro-3-deoxyphosphooctonate aldolase (KDO 8-P synthase)
VIKIVGPCVIDDTTKIDWGLDKDIIFKASFDKANRTRLDSYRGVGIERGIAYLSQVKHETGLRVTTDVHECWQVEKVAEVVDVIQIPAMLSRQTDLLVEAGKSGKCVNIKKGTFMTCSDVEGAIEKVGHDNVWVTERGTQYGDKVVVDFHNIVDLQTLGFPVILDVSHPVRGGDDTIAKFAKAGIAFGVDGIFVEVHPNPSEALCDGARAMSIEGWKGLNKDD